MESRQEPSTGPRADARWLIFAMTVFALVVVAGWQIGRRVRFPWDAYLWSESTFLTNMIKLTNGEALYSAPADVNSFVYSPGLDYATYALLRPLGLQLDIRYCRAISVALAVAAALAFGKCASILRQIHFPEVRSRLFTAVSTAVVFLVIYRATTSDVPHPDNAHIAHAGITMLLVLQALQKRSGRLALAAVLFGALGVFFKQVAALGGVGASLALIVGGFRGVSASARLVLAAVVATGASLAALWSIPWCKFYTFDLLSGHGINLAKIASLATRFSFQEHRFIPLLLTAAAVAWVIGSLSASTAKYWAAVLVLFFFEFAPSLTAYLKPMGWTNNMTILEVGMLLPVLPWLFACLSEPQSSPTVAATALTAALLLAFSYVPQKAVPTRDDYRYCSQLQYAIGRDLEAGKRVLLPHGAICLIRNRPDLVPLDRANSFLEIDKAGKSRLTGTLQRIQNGYYDSIYLNSPWYNPEIKRAIERHYREVRVIQGVVPKKGDEQGYQNGAFLAHTRVLERIR